MKDGISHIHWRAVTAGLAAVLLLAACSGPAPETVSPPAPGDGAELRQRIGVLPPQTLTDGACGMFLWARGSRANLVFFTSDATDAARIVMDGRELMLPRTLADGEFLFGQYTRQRFANEALTLRLSVQPEIESRMIGGTVVRQGTLSIEDSAGWSLVLPVAGMIACKSR